MSIGILASGPVQGALLTSQFHWVRPIVFSGVSDYSWEGRTYDRSHSISQDIDDHFNCNMCFDSYPHLQAQEFPVDLTPRITLTMTYERLSPFHQGVSYGSQL